MSRQRQAWGLLLVAVVFEVAFALGTGASRAFTRLGPSLFTVATALLGMFFLSRALREIEVGVGYTAWVGMGAVGTVVMGAWLYGEALTPARVLCFLLIIGGVAVLKLADRPRDAGR